MFLSFVFFLIFKLRLQVFSSLSAEFKKVKNLFCVKSLEGQDCQKIRKRKTAWRSPGRLGPNPVSGNVLDSISHAGTTPDLQVEIGPIRFSWADNIAQCPGGGWLCVHRLSCSFL